MKKILSAAMAAVLSMSMAFSSLAATKLEAPTVFWGEKREALPQWSRVEGAAGQYQVEAYKGDTRIYNSHHTFSADDKSEILSAGGFITFLKESGIYKFRIMALGDGNNTENSDWSSFSDNWSFTKANVTFGAPSNLHWEGTTVCWDAPEIPEKYQSYLLGYDVELYADGKRHVTHHNVRGTSQDQTEWMDVEGAKEYTFSVRTLSNTPSVIFHGDVVTCAESYDAENTKTDVSGKLDEILQGDETSILDAPDTLSKDIKDLQVAMQSDDAVLGQVNALEKEYAEAKGIKTQVTVNVSDDVEMDGDVTIIGALLNAKEGVNEVQFNISKPKEETVVDHTAYKNCIQFDFKLQNAVSTLKVPVRITVPIPESINPKFFRILHDHGNGKIEEINPLTVKIDTDVTPATASFTVTSFSTFIFAEAGADFENIATPSNADKFMDLAKALPDSMKGLEEEEQEGVKTALVKLMAALKDKKINTSIKNKFLESDEGEAVLLKIASLLHDLGGSNITLTQDEEIDHVVYFSPASGFFGTGEIPSMHFNFDLATPSNAREKLVFNISMELDGEETIELLSPMKFYITMPEGYIYNKNDKITVSGGKAKLTREGNCLVVFTTKLGTFKITSSGSSSSGSSSSSGGNSKSSSTPHLPPKSPAGGRWAKDGNTYKYYYSDGLLASNCWLEITWNNTTHWYHFNASGIMDTGWIKDNLGNWYYLNASADKVYGSMVTGWNLIDGKWYYFNEKSDGFKGTLLTDTTTPDGYQVNADGVWVR